jgi:hypothetical protein
MKECSFYGPFQIKRDLPTGKRVQGGMIFGGYWEKCHSQRGA